MTGTAWGFTRLEIPGGYITFGNRELVREDNTAPATGGVTSGEATRDIASHFYVKDYRGSVMAVCSGETGEVEQTMDYLPSGTVFRATNYGKQPRRFCGKEEMTQHSWNMYDSKARFQYARLPRFSTMDPLMELDYATSPYTYCRNDFVNLTDPTGLTVYFGYENGERVMWIDDPAIVIGHRQNFMGDIAMESFRMWTENANRYRDDAPWRWGGNQPYQTYMQRRDFTGRNGGGGSTKEATTIVNGTTSLLESNYIIRSALEYNTDFEFWHGKNGKYYWGLKGRGPNQHTGSRGAAKARADAFAAKANLASILGWIPLGIQTYNDLHDHRYYSAGARLLTNSAISASSRFPYGGPIIFAGLTAVEFKWGEDFYNWVEEYCNEITSGL